MELERTFRDGHCGLLALSFVAMSLAACDAQSDNPAAGSSVNLSIFEPQPDGTFKTVEKSLSFEDFKAMHERRFSHMRQAQSGVEESQEALSNRGAGNGYSPIAACDDDRTTWLYSVSSGWDPASWQYGGWLGCVGAAVGGSDWTGTLDLTTATFGGYSNWASSMYSLWTSNTYWVKFCSGGKPNVCTFEMSPWTLANQTALRYLTQR